MPRSLAARMHDCRGVELCWRPRLTTSLSNLLSNQPWWHHWCSWCSRQDFMSTIVWYTRRQVALTSRGLLCNSATCISVSGIVLTCYWNRGEAIGQGDCKWMTMRMVLFGKWNCEICIDVEGTVISSQESPANHFHIDWSSNATHESRRGLYWWLQNYCPWWNCTTWNPLATCKLESKSRPTLRGRHACLWCEASAFAEIRRQHATVQTIECLSSYHKCVSILEKWEITFVQTRATKLMVVERGLMICWSTQGRIVLGKVWFDFTPNEQTCQLLSRGTEYWQLRR